MNPDIASIIVQKIAGQRNLFLFLTIVLAIACCALSMKIVTSEEKVVMVPGLNADVTISNRRVSSSYLEQMSLVFLDCLLDLSPSDIRHKRDLILKHSSAHHAKFVKNLNEYFEKAEEEYKRFDLVTHFTVKNMEISNKDNSVIVHGILTSRFGKGGFETTSCSYRLTYDLVGNFLKLKEFSKLREEKNS